MGTVRDTLLAAAPGRVSDRISARLAKAHDASHYLLVPEFVVTAVDTADIAGLTRACATARVPLTFRAGGTSLSGQAASDSVLVDSRAHFRGIEVLDSGARVRAQPGATVRAVNARLAAFGRKLGPDPASESAATIGGVVANNSSGMACGTEFNAYQTLESVVLVLANGVIIDTSDRDADSQLAAAVPEIHRGLLALRDRVRDNPASVRTIKRLFALKNTMGYGVNSFLDADRPINILTRLVIGSEGTLAFVASATFRTVPLLRHVATGLMVFDDLQRATSVLPDLVADGFATVELLDATSLRVSQRDPQTPASLMKLTVAQHSALLIEHQAPDASELADRVAASTPLLARLGSSEPTALTSDARERAALWHLRKGLYATVAGNRPPGTTALLEDVAVPVETLASVCESLVQLFDAHRYEDSVIFGHAKDGNIHFMLNERFDGGTHERYLTFTEEMVDLVLDAGGTLKAEHGTGRIMAPYVRRQYGDELYEVMVEVKRLLDPVGIFNPGVIINDDPLAHIAHLKTSIPVEEEVDRCVECGFCEPVCPSKDVTLTPRMRIVLRRELEKARAAGDTVRASQLEQDYRYEGIETCAADGMCQTACPVLIDTGALVTRLRAEGTNPVARSVWGFAAKHWAGFSRMGSFGLTAAGAVPAVLPEVASRLARGMLGHDQVPGWSRDLPGGGRARGAQGDGRVQGAQGSGQVRRIRGSAASSPAASHPTVLPSAVHFAACVDTMFGSESGGAAAAFTTLCRRAGLGLVVPAAIDSLCCATPWKSKGYTEGYREMARRVLPSLWQASNHGELPVVCEASSCAEGLERMLHQQTDYPDLRIIDPLTFVAERVLPSLTVHQRVSRIVLHPTCSSTKAGSNDALLAIAAAVGKRVDVPQEWGCCAFAGDRGMLHPELTASATRAEATEVIAETYDLYLSSNRTCEIGMTRATGHTYHHVFEALEWATR